MAGALLEPCANPMSSAKLSRLLLGMGATLGIAAVLAMAVDLRVNIPDWMIKVAMVKLALVGAAGLFATGAILGRHANRSSLHADRGRARLDEPLPDFDRKQEQADSIRRESGDR